MEVQQLNEATNDIMVARLEIEEMEKCLEEEMAKNPVIGQLQDAILEKKNEKHNLQEELLEAMRGAQLKSWKTEQASFARASRTSVVIDPAFKKKVEVRLKGGEEIEGYSLSEKEFISVRISK